MSQSTAGIEERGSATALNLPAAPIVRQWQPQNLEFPFPSLSTFITPNQQFYVRCHFAIPAIDPQTWRLTIEGQVDREIQLSLDEIRNMPAQRRTVTLECAGNGRVFLHPKVSGAQWELGAVSTAEWTGVPLGHVLERAGLQNQANQIILQGADEGEPDDPPRPPGKIHYSHSVPRSKLDDVLLAYEMNGQPLPAPHGAPMRAIVGGWFGMASVKWLSRIIATDRPFRGYFQAVDYAYWEELAGNPVRTPITQMMVKAQIARPALNEIVPANQPYRIFGAAWAGDADVSLVEVSTDGGSTFSPATLLGEPIRHAWRFWEFTWRTPTPGDHTLMARATDSRGQRQSSERNKNFGNYVISHTLPILVQVK